MDDDFEIFKADLHIHSCLSPCADIEMSPRNVLEKASENGLKIIAITDHNSVENVLAFRKASKSFDIYVIYGMEITTKEEVHLLIYFPSLRKAKIFGRYLYQFMSKTEEETIFQEQIKANEFDEVVGFFKYNLYSSVNLSINKIFEEAKKIDALIIPAHIDREAFSIISQLGFIPENLPFDAVECYERNSFLAKEYSNKFKILTSSDSHYLHEVGKRYTLLKMKKRSFLEFKYALLGVKGREIIG